jgi:serine/threonine protein kinase
MGNKISQRQSLKDWLEKDYQNSQIKRLGNGCYGEVLKADSTPLGRPLAVKKIDLTEEKNRELLENFNLEGELMSLVDHPNILKCHYYGQYNNDFYIVVDYCNSGTLINYLERKPDLCLEDTLHIFSRILDGFTRLRETNIIHRDIKPENILFKDDEPVIGDFGLSQIGKEKSATTGGTPLYQAPETYFSNMVDRYDDDLIDVWSLGCLLYYLLYREEPFNAVDKTELERFIRANSGSRLKLPDSRRVPRRVRELLEYMLTINPDERCSWEELLDPQLLSGDLSIPMVKAPKKYRVRLEMLKTTSSLSRVPLPTAELPQVPGHREESSGEKEEQRQYLRSVLSSSSDLSDEQSSNEDWFEELKKSHEFMLHTSRQLMKVAREVGQLGVQRDMFRIASILALRRVIQTCDRAMEQLKRIDHLCNVFDKEESWNNTNIKGYHYCAEMRRKCLQLIRQTVQKTFMQFDPRTKPLLGELNNNRFTFEAQLESFLKHELCIYRLEMANLKTCSPETRISIACGLTFLYFTIESDRLSSLAKPGEFLDWKSMNEHCQCPSFLIRQLNHAFEKYRNS